MTKAVNKFLIKSYHMVSDSDPTIVSWTGVGDSFTVKDIAKFQKHILPKYFSHSKYSSYVRQLNFYGFRKMSQDSGVRIIVPKEIVDSSGNATDDDSSSASESVTNTSNQQNPTSTSSSASGARFMHEYFRRGMPELLSQIQRSTAKPNFPTLESEDYEALHAQIASLKGQMKQMVSQVDRKVELAVQLVRNDYMTKVTRLEASCQSLGSMVSIILQGKAIMGSFNASQPSHFTLQQFLEASKHATA